MISAEDGHQDYKAHMKNSQIRGKDFGFNKILVFVKHVYFNRFHFCLITLVFFHNPEAKET
jgi:hypothetical protein